MPDPEQQPPAPGVPSRAQPQPAQGGGLPPARPAPAPAPASAPAPKPAAVPPPTAAAPKPAAAPAPAASAPKPAAPPRAPGLGELFEQSLTGLFNPGVYRAAAARPAPSFGAALGLALSAGAASLLVNFAHGAASTPDFLSRFSPALMAAVGTAAIGLYASIMLLLAVMLYGLGNALGGKGDFDRGLQAAAMISVLWPVQMLCNWFPYAWVIPSALTAWIAACALEGLFGAKPAPTRGLFAVFAAAAIGVQTLGHMIMDRARETYGAADAVTRSADANADLARQIQAIQERAQAAGADGAAAAAAGQAPVSSLDLLRAGPSDDGGAQPQAAPPPPAAMITAAKGMEANAVGMLDAMTPMLNNPAVTRNMTPEQKANLKELQAMMADLKAQAASGKRLSDPEFAARMSRYQQLMMKFMAAAAAAPSPAAPAAAPATTPRIHLKLPEDGK